MWSPPQDLGQLCSRSWLSRAHTLDGSTLPRARGRVWRKGLVQGRGFYFSPISSAHVGTWSDSLSSPSCPRRDKVACFPETSTPSCSFIHSGTRRCSPREDSQLWWVLGGRALSSRTSTSSGARGLEPGVLLPPPPSREVSVGQHWAGPLTAECLLIPVSWAETRSRHQVYHGGLGQVLGSNSVPGRCSDQLPSWKQQAVWGWLALAFQTAQGFSWWPRGYEQGARCPQHRQVEQRRVTRAPASGAAPHSALLGFPVLQASSSELTSARLPGSTSHIRPRPSLPIWGLLVTTENGGCLSPIIGASAFSIERQLFSVLWTRIKKTFSSVFPPSIGVM